MYVGENHIPEVNLALRSDKLAVSKETLDSLNQPGCQLASAARSHRLLSASWPQLPLKATGVCSLRVCIGTRQLSHIFSIVPKLEVPVLIGADLLVRLGAQLDTFNQVLWSRTSAPADPPPGDPEALLSGQTIPQACQAASESDTIVPPRTSGVPVRLAVLKGQRPLSQEVFFQPLPCLRGLNLVVCGTPTLGLNNRSTYLLVENPTQSPVQIRAKPLGVLIDKSFHDFELSIPVIGELPLFMGDSQSISDALLTFPSQFITVKRHKALPNRLTCGATLGLEGHLHVYTLTTQPTEPANQD